MFYYLYEIRNKLDGKIYVGVHKTKNMDDGYMGSGRVIRRAIEKHGIENFAKTILETFEDTASMFTREKEVVTEEFLAREDVYNLQLGGHGGFDYINKIGKNINTVLEDYNRSDAHKESSKRGYHRGIGKPGFVAPKFTREINIELSERAKSDSAIKKKKNTFKENKHSQGERNTQFGTCWMWHELVGNKKCKKDLLPLFIEQGWIKGRFI